MTPAASACSRTPLSGYAVIRIVGMGFPKLDRRLYSSSPVIPGICMSAIRQEVRRTWRELKNSCADATASTLYPSDLMRPFIASRIDSSSSMIEISGFAFGTRPPAPGLVIVMMRRDPKPLGAGGYSRHFRKMRQTQEPADYTLV